MNSGTNDRFGRVAWRDRFNRPTLEVLAEAMPEDPAERLRTADDRLASMTKHRPTFAWRGDCWRWTVEYGTGGHAEPVAILIPNPDDLQLAAPVEPDFLDSLPTARMKRAIRDGLGLAQTPFDTRWAVWSITSATLLDELLDLMERNVRHLQKKTG